jgi:hypothetical protein
MALKNEAIGPSIPKTRKGTVAHVRPPKDSVLRQSELAPAKCMVFPHWQAGSPLEFSRLPKAQSFMALATSAFNYELLGKTGFCTVREIVNDCDAYHLVYSDLGGAIAWLEDRLAGDGGD